MQSDKPFADTLKHLLALLGMSQRELSKRAAEHGWPYSHSNLHRMINGGVALKPEDIEVFAEVLQIPPETFAEYRLWKVRHTLEPKEVGFKEAVGNLTRLEEAGVLDDVAEPQRHRPGKHLRPSNGGEESAASS